MTLTATATATATVPLSPPWARIRTVGEDCAGAVQFVREERLQEVLGPGVPEIGWLDEAGVGARLRGLREDESAWRAPRDTGQFSLAGAQAKTALLFLSGRWGVPSGQMATTHILKPHSKDFDGQVENEHFCLALARALGIPTASSEVRRFAGELAIVVERYDRVQTATMAAAAFAQTQPILRLHQEDLCQALALPPTSKYQSDGGPSPARIVELLRTYSSKPEEDVSTFVDVLAFNWLIAGTDGHAKNYSLLHSGGGRVRLAPLYDLASALVSRASLPGPARSSRRLPVRRKACYGVRRARPIGCAVRPQGAQLLQLARDPEGLTGDRHIGTFPEVNLEEGHHSRTPQDETGWRAHHDAHGL